MAHIIFILESRGISCIKHVNLTDIENKSFLSLSQFFSFYKLTKMHKMQQDFVKQKLKKKNLNKVPLWHSQTRNFLYVPIRAYRAKVRKL